MLYSLLVLCLFAFIAALDAAPYDVKRVTGNAPDLELELSQAKRQLFPGPFTTISIPFPNTTTTSESSTRPLRTITPVPPISVLPFPQPTSDESTSSSIPTNLPPFSGASSVGSIIQTGAGPEPTIGLPDPSSIFGFPSSIFEPGPVDPTLFSNIPPPIPNPSPIVSLPIPVFTPVSISEIPPPFDSSTQVSAVSSSGFGSREPTRTFGIPFSSVPSFSGSIIGPGPVDPSGDLPFPTPIPVISFPVPTASSIPNPESPTLSSSPLSGDTSLSSAATASTSTEPLSSKIPSPSFPSSRLGPGPVRPSISELPTVIPISGIFSSESGPISALPTFSDLPLIPTPVVPLPSSSGFVFGPGPAIPTISVLPSVPVTSVPFPSNPSSLIDSSSALPTLGDLPSIPVPSILDPTFGPGPVFPTITDLSSIQTSSVPLPSVSESLLAPGTVPTPTISIVLPGLPNINSPSEAIPEPSSTDTLVGIPGPTGSVYIILSTIPNPESSPISLPQPTSVAPNDCPTISAQCCQNFLPGKDVPLDGLFGSLGVEAEELIDVWIGLACEAASSPNSRLGQVNGTCTQV